MHTHTHRGRNGEDLNIQIKNRGGAERHLGEQLHCKYQPSVRFDVEHWRERGRSIRLLRREGGESRRGGEQQIIRKEEIMSGRKRGMITEKRGEE